ncbi:DUF2780 domain-containing protein [Stutzerimonas kirkiae]|uniref:DUF2780 domain-containing protein n=1 Tax=Stutzerimonas kirkiae TaxID=2211392 RepID=A0A4Q9RAX9_9GAMM|nr:DUF2780 domain-containing protein [Stutzerimonas kirkiae]TBU97949.1 hypothetical protein DNJ96_07450 [Stutzerimonas kirkiae]TBV04535.1 hypothetical protein DNJ95_04820 [Stutzerimonas kirkiae]TBV11571.1 hypothetical protein DNK08_02875 [Stutzerimonas kirkiae]TBV16127.1 hypothetical protein DNK01_03925 [Stutzerimonas kirkiae]
MNAIIEQLASQLDIQPQQAESAAGSIFKLVREQAPSGDFQQLLAALPQVGEWIARAGNVEAAPSASGGLFGSVGGLLGGLAGDTAQGGIAGALGELARTGLNADTLGRFVPALLEQLRQHIDPALLEKLLQAVPALSQLSGNGSAAGLGGLLGGLLK